MSRMLGFFLPVALALPSTLALSGCAAPQYIELPCPEQQCAAMPLAQANLHAVLWTQRAVEFDALVTQTWQLAEANLDAALDDPTWTAAVEQTDGFAELPPAIVLDVDETVLDNSGYQAWLVETGGAYDRDSWNAWCEAREATAIPGVVPFLQALDARGVTIFYVTNRYAVTEQATRDNLAALGLPISDEVDTVLLRGEYDDGASEKSDRRRRVADTHRILMLFGDNLGDFVDGYKTTPEAREALAAEYAGWWGTRWFVLPNPQYGSWEGALFGFDYGIAPEERHQIKIDAMDAWEGPSE